KGDLEIKESEQYFDEATNTFLADRFIKGTCPNCSYDNAFGDQCEKCGKSLSPEELINPVSTLSGNAPVKKATKHWYLPLNKHEDFLREWVLKEHKDDWRANVVGQVKSWIDGGLQPRAVTRDLDWGVRLPPQPPKGGNEDTTHKSKDSYNYRTADPMTYSLLKDYAEKHRSQPTEAENVLWELLRGKKLGGYKFRRQHIINNFIADFICLEYNLIIEVDGLIHQLPENIISDIERTEQLNKLGFEVIRFTNNEVLFETEKVLANISKKLEKIANSEPVSQIPPLGGGGAKVLYVWFDAPIGYISATKQWALNNDKDWKPYWYNDDTKLVHFIGKDNIVFHAIIFPVMLKLNGNILPTNVPSNEFMNLEGDKMSTSRGWSIEMDDYINDWIKPENGGGQMADALRYYLTAIAPETKDSEFTWKGFAQSYKSELSDILGNFVNRTFVLMHKLCGSKVPKFHNDIIDEDDKELVNEIQNSKFKIQNNLEEYKFRDAQFEVIDLARKGNQYLQKKEPWKRKAVDGKYSTEDQQHIDNCIHLCLQLTANLSILIHPFLPYTSKKMLKMMKVVERMLDWENAGKIDLLKVGYSLNAPEILFRKIEDAEIDAQIEKLKLKSQKVKESKVEANNIIEPLVANVKPEIVFDDFAKIDLKVGTILSAEKVEKADKLLKLEVDLGFEKRTIVSGIAMHFAPENTVGKQVTVVCNLAPRKMRGIESNGMILMAEDKAGKLHFVNPDNKVDEGSGVS
ncbi:MAG: methionine--tRNA ligase subunit beta, partial [Bacteroidetes bacterium]|nr:methionine--tRNA ligase subunit beta [Bacteroidota bacterium]